MRKTLRELLPLAIALVVYAVVQWFLLADGWAIGPWLLTIFLVAHGLAHLLFVIPRPALRPGAAAVDWPFDLGSSWLLGRIGLEGRQLRSAGLVLVVLIVIGYSMAGLATLGLVVPADWWAALVLAATAVSALLMLLWFRPGLVLGLAIDAVLAWLVLSGAWRP
jgi:hypothetical protein